MGRVVARAALGARRGLLYAGYGSRPRFLIIGAQKAGTTALFDYLRAHPRVVGSSTKELGFFSPEAFAEWPTHPNHRVLHGGDPGDPLGSRSKRAWYHSHFPLPYRLHGRVPFEATPEYLYVSAAPERIHSYDPAMKLIALVREPAERAFAAWTMYSNFGSYRPQVYAARREKRPFDVAIRAELDEIARGSRRLEPGYVARGLYAEQLDRYRAHFPDEQLLVVDSQRLAGETAVVVDEVLAFLGLEPLGPRDWPRVHTGSYRSDRSEVEPTLELLRAYFRPENRRLAAMLAAPPRWAQDHADD